MREFQSTHNNLIDISSPIGGIIAGLMSWYFTGSIGWGIAGALVGLVVAFFAIGQISKIYGCGPTREELRNAFVNFDKNGVNDDRFYMWAEGRRLNIYWESRESFFGAPHVLGLELPWEDWKDKLPNESFRKELKELSAKPIEGSQALFIETGNDIDKLLRVMATVLNLVDKKYDDLKFNLAFRSGAGFDGHGGRIANMKESTGVKK